MKRILILSSSEYFIENFRMELVSELISKGHKVYISLPKEDKSVIFEKMGAIIIDTPVSRRGVNPFVDYKLIKRYKKIIKEVRPDYIFSHTIKPNIYGGIAASKLNVPFIGNVSGLGTAFQKGLLFKKVIVFLYKKAFNNVHTVFFENDTNLKLFEENNIGHGSLKLIPGSGVNLDLFKYQDYPKEDKISFLFLGRIMKEKGIEEFLKAAIEIKSRHHNVEFNIVGNFEEEHYREQINKLELEGILNYKPSTQDVVSILSKTSALIQPSHHEGLSNVLIESAATGKPVIASNIPGCLETFDEGISGLSFEAKNFHSLVDKIEMFIEMDYKKREKMGEMGRKKMEREFSREIVTKAYIDIVNNP